MHDVVRRGRVSPQPLTEYQFVNLGLAVHAAELLDLANDKHITVTVG